jgi:hypothetical protein
MAGNDVIINIVKAQLAMSGCLRNKATKGGQYEADRILFDGGSDCGICSKQ